jgi:hypothetical protein
VGPQAVKSRSLGEYRFPCETCTDFSQPACFCSCSRQLLRATCCSPAADNYQAPPTYKGIWAIRK